MIYFPGLPEPDRACNGNVLREHDTFAHAAANVGADVARDELRGAAAEGAAAMFTRTLTSGARDPAGSNALYVSDVATVRERLRAGTRFTIGHHSI